MAAMARMVVAAAFLFCSVMQAQAAVVKNLQVEYRTTPLGIDVQQPRFSWQMDGAAGERGVAQAAYQVDVRDPKGALVWDSKQIDGSDATPHPVRRERAEARHALRVDRDGVDRAGATADRQLVVRNGPDGSGAAVAGVERRDVDRRRRRRPGALRAVPRRLRRELCGDDRAGQHARELRLRRQRLAADGPEQEHPAARRARKDGSYIKLELDVSALDGSPDARAKLHVYRVGYKDTDTPDEAASSTFDIDALGDQQRQPARASTRSSSAARSGRSRDRRRQQRIEAGGGPDAGRRRAAAGGRPNAVNLNPMGQGGDYLPFGLLCDIGFSVEPGQRASFRDVTVRNNRAPNTMLFREDLTARAYTGIFAGRRHGRRRARPSRTARTC